VGGTGKDFGFVARSLTTNHPKQFCCLRSGFAERVSKLRSGSCKCGQKSEHIIPI